MNARITNNPGLIKQLVINWHVTEACNYTCRYCYSSWISESERGELIQKPQASSKLLKELYRFFKPSNTANPLQSVLEWKEIRLSLAGGETLLYPERTKRITQEAKDLGFKLSLITNASLLTHPDYTALFKNLSMLGISLDSANPQTNHQIGRIERTGQTLNLDELVTTVQLARSENPALAIKINTVVNKFNADENLTELIERLQPDKWKVLRVLPVINADLEVSDQQFQSFIERHQHLENVLSAENNQDMTESYLMVDPFGRFFQNQATPTEATPYRYSKPILQVGADVAFGQINFDAHKFAGRYSRLLEEVVA